MALRRLADDWRWSADPDRHSLYSSCRCVLPRAKVGAQTLRPSCRRVVRLTRYNRPIAFSWIQAAILLPQIVFLPIGSAFISINPWIPMFATTILGTIAILIACVFLPESFPTTSEHREQNGERQALLGRGTCNDPARHSLRSQLIRASKNVTRIYHGASSNLGVGSLLASLFAFNFGLQADGIMLLLYASKRLGWTLDAVRRDLCLQRVKKLTSSDPSGIIVLISSNYCHVGHSFHPIACTVQTSPSPAKVS